MKALRNVALGAVIFAAAVPVSHADDPFLTPLERLRWKLGEHTTLAAGFRLQNDTVRFSDPSLENDSDLRRARASLRLDHNDWRLGVDYDVGISDGWKNVQLEYRGWRRQRIVLGNQVAPLAMEDLTSSSNLPFVERSVAAAIAPGTLAGISYRRWWDNASLHVGAFGDELSGQDRRRLPGRSVIGRATWAPLNTRDAIVHLGGGVELRNVDANAPVRLRARPASRLATRRLVDTRSIDGVTDARLTHVEAAVAVASLRLQAEADRMRLDTPTGPLDLAGHYVMASVALGTEPYRYRASRGTFTRLRPAHRFGALELSARYGALDLNDGTLAGGRQVERAIGATWVLNRNVMLSLNRTRVDAAPDRNGADTGIDVTSLRLDFRW